MLTENRRQHLLEQRRSSSKGPVPYYRVKDVPSSQKQTLGFDAKVCWVCNVLRQSWVKSILIRSTLLCLSIHICLWVYMFICIYNCVYDMHIMASFSLSCPSEVWMLCTHSSRAVGLAGCTLFWPDSLHEFPSHGSSKLLENLLHKPQLKEIINEWLH